MILGMRTWDSNSPPTTAMSPAPSDPQKCLLCSLVGLVMAPAGGVRVQLSEAVKRLLEASKAGSCPTPPLHTLTQPSYSP